MGQIKFFARTETLDRLGTALSDVVHRALVSAFAYPVDKRFHRFLPLEEGRFLYPTDRGPDYLILEVLLFPGRSAAAKKSFYRDVLAGLATLGLDPHSVEITLIEVPRENWCIRGVPGDELTLGYRVDV